MINRKRLLVKASFIILFAIGLVLRLLFLPANTIDMKVFNLQWYDYIVSHGIINAMGDEFANYTPPYLYLLSLATLTKSFLPKLTAIKLIPITFDLVNSFLVYKIVRIHFVKGVKPFLAAMLFLVLPTVIINGSFWGQADAFYTCFLLLCLLFLLQGRSIASITAFAIAFSVKAQAVFLLPFLVILFLKKQITWQNFLLIPPIYFLMMLPAIFAGRTITSLFLTYVIQGNTFASASMNAPNLYFFLPKSIYQVSWMVGIVLAVLILFAWTLRYGSKSYLYYHAFVVITALVSLSLTPFLLPKMHDRYFYPADVFSLVAAFFVPEIWFIPIAYQFISMFSYAPFLFNLNPERVIPIATGVNILTIGFLLWKQRKMILSVDKQELEEKY